MDQEVVQKVMELVALAFRWINDYSNGKKVKQHYSKSASQLLYEQSNIIELFMLCFKTKHLSIV